MSTPAVGVKAPSITPAAAARRSIDPRPVERRSGEPRAGEHLPGQRQIPGSISWRAFGGTVNLVVAHRDRLDLAASLTADLLAEVQHRCDARRRTSDLARANDAAGEWVTVDPLLVTAVEAAVRCGASTAGPGDGPGSSRIGVEAPGRVRVPAGGHIDLGTTLRAFAADLVAAQVPARAGTPLIVGLGGDVAVGRLPGHPQQWRVTLSETGHDPDGEQVLLERGGLATVRLPVPHRGETGGAHLVDPRSGARLDPAWRSITVCAASCLDAHAAASGAMLMGELAPAWLWEHDLAARLITTESLSLRVAGWPDPA